ncbi:MAG: SulP family inorganic anion transporter [Bacteroidales bacterium]|jgi:SulP family sulfate permease|nr:SulP family inorganic anion transporter [Bacteroidales bacterium]
MENISIVERIKSNWKSGITVAFVSIPLALALAIASGATPTQGIITAFWAGLLGAILGGSHFNIIGPTGALSGILMTFAIVNGYAVLPVVAIVSGLITLAVYFLKLDRYIIFIPKVVVHGFTLGVAFIIVLGQLDNMLGLKDIPKTEVLTDNVLTSLRHYAEINWVIFAIFIILTLFIIFWNKKFPKFPGAIVVAVVSIATVFIFREWLKIDFEILTLSDNYPEVEAGFFFNVWGTLRPEIFLDKEIWAVSIATSVIAILETLISGQIADNMTNTKFDRSKEVLSLAIANIGSGVMGGIPATAALARTALNIKSGANNRMSGIINSAAIIVIALLLFGFFKHLPMVAIAAILVVVSINMVETKHFITLVKNEKVAFVLSIFVAIITIVYDPIAGILTGSFFALLIFVNEIAKGQTEIQLWENWKMKENFLLDEYKEQYGTSCDFIVLKISGMLTYINMPAYLDTAKMMKQNKFVIISLRTAFYADSDGVSYLEEIIGILKQQNERVIITGINKEIENLVKDADFYKEFKSKNNIFENVSHAIDHLKEIHGVSEVETADIE